MKKRAGDKRLLVANEMPPMYRRQPNQIYDHENDEVLKWIAEHPGLLNYMFDKLSTGKHIEYNPDTGIWQGVDYDGN